MKIFVFIVFLFSFCWIQSDSIARENGHVNAERRHIDRARIHNASGRTSSEIDSPVLRALEEDVYVPRDGAESVCQVLGGDWESERCVFSLSPDEIAQLLDRANHFICQRLVIGGRHCRMTGGNCVCDVVQVVNVVQQQNVPDGGSSGWEPVPVSGERRFFLDGLMLNGDRWRYVVKRRGNEFSICAIKARRGQYFCGNYARVGNGVSSAVYPPTRIEAARLESNGTSVRIILRDGYGRDRRVINVRFDVSEHNPDIPVLRTRDYVFKISVDGTGSWTWHSISTTIIWDDWGASPRQDHRSVRIPWMRRR